MKDYNYKYTLSIIIPVYNVERYIERCVRSLFNQQDQDNVEYIFVDDCSPDKSISILRKVLCEYPNIETRVKIVRHERNKGLPKARKTGFLNSSGKYIYHVDSDDWVEPNLLRVVQEYLNDKDCDILGFNYYQGSESNKSIKRQHFKRDQYIEDLLTHKISPCVWNKIVRRTMYDEIEFAEYGMGEDLFLNIQLANNASNINYILEVLYNYFDDPNSMSRNINESHRFIQFNELKYNVDKIENILEMNGQLNNYLPAIVHLRQHVKNTILPVLYNWKNLKLWLRTYPSNNYLVLFNPFFSIWEKVRHLSILTGIYYLYKRIRRKHEDKF